MNGTFIDPCGGSGDFLVGIIKKALFKNIDNINENIHYWDINISQDASNVASLNMILNGEGRSHIKVIDSLDEYQFKNNHFSVCITNPPFGTNTNIMNKYCLGKKKGKPFKQELGILFIERCINLLKKVDLLFYQLVHSVNNPSLKYIREFLISNGPIIASRSDATSLYQRDYLKNPTILFFKKEIIKYLLTLPRPPNRRFLRKVPLAAELHQTRKNAPKIFKRDDNGDFLLDENNRKIVDNDLIVIQKILFYE